MTAGVALACWRARGPLALRYPLLLIATVLVTPHLWAYDLVLLMPAYLLLWDWDLAGRHVGRFSPGLQALLYVCYFAPLFGLLADVTHIQSSVLARRGSRWCSR